MVRYQVCLLSTHIRKVSMAIRMGDSLDQVDQDCIFRAVIISCKVNPIGNRITVEVQHSQPERPAGLNGMVCQGELVTAWTPLSCSARKAQLADCLSIHRTAQLNHKLLDRGGIQGKYLPSNSHPIAPQV